MTTLAAAGKAVRDATEQRLLLLPLLRMDLSKVAPALVEDCQKAHAAAESDPMKFDAMLSHPAVVKLFSCGALFFGKAA